MNWIKNYYVKCNVLEICSNDVKRTWSVDTQYNPGSKTTTKLISTKEEITILIEIMNLYNDKTVNTHQVEWRGVSWLQRPVGCPGSHTPLPQPIPMTELLSTINRMMSSAITSRPIYKREEIAKGKINIKDSWLNPYQWSRSTLILGRLRKKTLFPIVYTEEEVIWCFYSRDGYISRSSLSNDQCYWCGLSKFKNELYEQPKYTTIYRPVAFKGFQTFEAFMFLESSSLEAFLSGDGFGVTSGGRMWIYMES